MPPLRARRMWEYPSEAFPNSAVSISRHTVPIFSSSGVRDEAFRIKEIISTIAMIAPPESRAEWRVLYGGSGEEDEGRHQVLKWWVRLREDHLYMLQNERGKVIAAPSRYSSIGITGIFTTSFCKNWHSSVNGTSGSSDMGRRSCQHRATTTLTPGAESINFSDGGSQYCFQFAQNREPQGAENSVECGEEMFALRIFRPSQGVELFEIWYRAICRRQSRSLVRISSELNHLEYRARYIHGESEAIEKRSTAISFRQEWWESPISEIRIITRALRPRAQHGKFGCAGTRDTRLRLLLDVKYPQCYTEVLHNYWFCGRLSLRRFRVYMSALNDNGVALDGSAGRWRLFGGVAQQRRLRRPSLRCFGVRRAPSPMPVSCCFRPGRTVELSSVEHDERDCEYFKFLALFIYSTRCHPRPPSASLTPSSRAWSLEFMVGGIVGNHGWIFRNGRTRLAYPRLTDGMGIIWHFSRFATRGADEMPVTDLDSPSRANGRTLSLRLVVHEALFSLPPSHVPCHSSHFGYSALLLHEVPRSGSYWLRCFCLSLIRLAFRAAQASHRSSLLSVAREGRGRTHRPRALLFQTHTTSAICVRRATTIALAAYPARPARQSSSRQSRPPPLLSGLGLLDDRAPHALLLSNHAHSLRPASSAVNSCRPVPAPPPSPSTRLFAARTWADRNRNALDTPASTSGWEGGRGEEDGDVPVDLEVPADPTPGPFRGRRIEQTSDFVQLDAVFHVVLAHSYLCIVRRSIPLTYSLCL
ncbi:hypothetical protein C8J57DRAFT_1474371 [Mycena rebaudengoi]|nr:hypothetical protein C8J57DRAFT_1474371 [Mycena rebaudengoi]